MFQKGTKLTFFVAIFPTAKVNGKDATLQNGRTITSKRKDTNMVR